MNVTLPEKSKMDKKVIFIYITVIAICVVSIITAFYIQFYARIDLGKVVGVSTKDKIKPKKPDEITELKENFNNIFKNDIEEDSECQNNKQEADKKIVYTKYKKQYKKEEDYDININIPYFNVKDEKTKELNSRIENDFTKLAKKIIKSEKKDIIYTVEYAANVKQGILSLIIKSNYKEGKKAQRTIIKSYNYDLRNKKEITLEEILRIEEIDKKEAQNKINEQIKVEKNSAEEFRKLGYSFYQRDENDEMYKIENTDTFYLTKDTLYVIYPYGNNNETTEKDMIIF